MSAYLLIDITVKDKAPYMQYIEKARPIVENYGGEYIIRGGAVTPLFGDWLPERIILIKFPSKETIEKCFSSKEYLEIKHLRENSTITKSVILEGFPNEVSARGTITF